MTRPPIDPSITERYATIIGNRKVLTTRVLIGEPASKANSRRLVMVHGRIIPIKSSKALAYSRACAIQCPILNPLPTEELFICGTIWYRTQRPDLDPSIIYDALAGRLYVNDRQLRETHWYHQIDRDNPRAEIVVGLRFTEAATP